MTLVIRPLPLMLLLLALIVLLLKSQPNTASAAPDKTRTNPLSPDQVLQALNNQGNQLIREAQKRNGSID